MSKTKLFIFPPRLNLNYSQNYLKFCLCWRMPAKFSRCSSLTQFFLPFLTANTAESSLGCFSKYIQALISFPTSSVSSLLQATVISYLGYCNSFHSYPVLVYTLNQDSIMSLFSSSTQNKIKVSEKDWRPQETQPLLTPDFIFYLSPYWLFG